MPEHALPFERKQLDRSVVPNEKGRAGRRALPYQRFENGRRLKRGFFAKQAWRYDPPRVRKC